MPRNAPYRTLILIYVLAILAGIAEYHGRSSHHQVARDIYGDPVRNFPEAMVRLYPGTAEAEYLQGRRIEAMAGRKLKGPPADPSRLPALMAEFNANLKEAARHYERALSMGLKSDETLYYNYALTLIRLQAAPERIEAAIAAWRTSFPFSNRRDLQQRRKVIEEQLRHLPRGIGSRENADDENDETSSDVPRTFRPLNVAAAGAESNMAADFVPDWRLLAGFAGSRACRDCHPEQFATYLQTAHSRALSDVEPDAEPPDAEFNHTASGRRFRVTRREGKLIHGESLLLDDGTDYPLTSMPVRYRVGSGRFARTYLCDAGGGFLTESPITWYTGKEAWGMTPGFDKPVHRSFSRQVLQSCLWCHSGLFQTSTTSDFRLNIVEQAIGCERCHGPGAGHVQAHTDGGPVAADTDATIVNPRRLPRKLAEAVCQQCHLQGDIHIGGRNRRATEFQPGEPLEAYMTAYRLWRREPEMTVVGHVEQLAGSSCYQRSESLTCVSCHDPHAAVAVDEQVGRYRMVCLSCHHDQGCKLPLAMRNEKWEDDCVHCHMPKSATEVPHLAFTHHRIGIHPLKSKTAETDTELLLPLSDLQSLDAADQTRSLMLARLQMFLIKGPAYQASTGGERLRHELHQWLKGLPEDEIDAETEFARFQILSVGGNWHEAERSAQRAFALRDIRSEERAAILEQLAVRDFVRNQFGQARAEFEELARIRRDGQDWFNLGICEEGVGHLDVAVRSLETALQLKPADLRICEELARLRHGRREEEDERRLIRHMDQLKHGGLARSKPPSKGP